MINDPLAAAEFEQTLTAEAGAVEQFVELLKREQTALSAGNVDALPSFVEQKSALAGELAVFSSRRNATLVAQGFPADRAGVAAWCAKNPKRKNAAAVWAKILILAGEARELIRLSGELITLRMQYNSNALDALRGASRSLDLYGPDGQTTAPGNRRIIDAV